MTKLLICLSVLNWPNFYLLFFHLIKMCFFSRILTSIVINFIFIIITFAECRLLLFPPRTSSSTPSVPSDCKITETYGYSYDEFHPLIDQSKNNWTEPIGLNFSVSIVRDAHILLCEKINPGMNDRVYEIALGTKLNMFSELRLYRGAPASMSVFTPNLLSSVEMRAFWITVDKDGKINIGGGSNRTVILSYNEPNPIRVKYFSFSSWHFTYGKWMYDCARRNDSSEESESKKKKPEVALTPKERLYRDLVRNMDVVALPVYGDSDSPVNIFVAMNILRISLNMENGELSATGLAVIEWNDDRLIWESGDYDGLDRLFIKGYQSWKPNIISINAAENKFNKPFSVIRSGVIIKSHGTVVWSPKVDMRSMCDLNFQNWPWDTHICKIQLSMWAQNVSLADVTLWKENVISDWLVEGEITSTYSRTMETTEFTFSHFSGGGNSEYDYTLELSIHLKRRTSFFHNLFYYLFIVVSVLLLIAVCASPLGTKKMALNCFTILLLSGLLIMTACSLPDFTQQTPTIVTAYSVMLVTAAMYAAVTAFLLGLIRTKHETAPPQYIVAILDNVLFATVCCLPSKHAVRGNGVYDAVKGNNFNSDEKSQKSIMTKSKQNNVLKMHWLKLISAVDNIFSALVLLVTVFLLNSF